MLDYYNLSTMLSTDELQIQSSARNYLESEISPHVSKWWEDGEFPDEKIPEFGRMGFFGANLPVEYGCAGVNNVAYGLIMYELERVDSGLRSFASVQGALVMYPIYRYGSEDQKKKYLPEMAKGNTIGCFGLTEHDGGSDPGAMKTNAKKDGESYILNGTKMWITNGNIADVALVWAKDETDTVRGFLIPTDTPGFTANKIEHKMSMRASVTSELVLEDVRVPATSILPESNGLSAPLSCLTQARYGIAWGMVGAAVDCYNTALEYSKDRKQFSKPIAGYQLTQAKLAEMITRITESQLLAYRLGRLKDEGKMTFQQVSMAKRSNCAMARDIARTARGILGGNGIVEDYSPIRHMANIESVYTYEGTHEMHSLIIGESITGISAYDS